MNERDIFLAAIEITDSKQRTAYVKQACGGNTTLHFQVEELLRTADRAQSRRKPCRPSAPMHPMRPTSCPPSKLPAWPCAS